MIKLIASDMDGTLLDGNGGISAYNVKMIKEAKEKGIYFVIASGKVKVCSNMYSYGHRTLSHQMCLCDRKWSRVY